MPVWTPSPAFASGQYLSAEAHLNTLADNCNELLAMYHARQLPYSFYSAGWPIWTRRGGSYFQARTDDGWLRLWTGYIRNKADALRYIMSWTADVNGLDIRIEWGSTKTTILSQAGAGSGSLNSTIDVSSLTADSFYPLNVDARGHSGDIGTSTITIGDLYEENPPAYGTLAAFNATNTPTGAQWQELATRAETLYAQVSAPRVPFLGGIVTADNTIGLGVNYATLWLGSFVHLHRYWYYDVRLGAPNEDGDAWVTLTINGTEYELGRRTFPTDRWPAPHTPDEGDTGDTDEGYQFWTHRGTVDVNALGLTIGARYYASVKVTFDGTATQAKAKLLALWQQTPQTPSIAWWEVPPTWARGDTVTGASNVKALRNDLEDLSDTTRIVYRNRPTPECTPLYHPGLWAARYHRWLHYYCKPKSDAETDDPPSPSLGYWAGDKWEEISLPYEANKWLAYDLDGARRLFEGTHYRLRDVSFALEDGSD